MTQIDHRPAVGVELEKRAAVDIAPAPLDAELVEPDERQVRPRKRAEITVLGRRPEDVQRSAKALVRSAPRSAARTGYTAAVGGLSLGQRIWAAATHGPIRKQIRLAEAVGDRVALGEWSDRLQDAKDRRLQRVLGMPKAVISAVVVGAVLFGVVMLLAFIGGVVAWLVPDDGMEWSDWWGGFGAVVSTIWALVRWAFWLTPVGLLALGSALAIREGRRVASTPAWLMTGDERAQAGAEVTADSITKAMQHMKLPALTKALKEGQVLEFLVSPREQGGGTYFQVRLPMGVVAADFLPTEKVELLAGNLLRLKHEVWPQRQADSDARVLDCWAADKGTMDKPAPAWPLLDDGTFNVYRDRLPWGVTMRGEPITVGMRQKHWLVGANSKQGKTTAVRTLLLGLALDPDVEFRIADLKGDGDFKMFEPMCHTYIEGQADEDAEAAVIMLEDLVAEMQRRYDEKARLGIVGGITEQLARKRGSGFHPIFAVVDECQVMYMAGKAADGSLLGGSKDDSRGQKAAKRLHDQARAVEIQLIQSTQRPDPQTVPVRVREGVHVRASLYVPNINAAKMILADAAERGARPYDLRAGRDAGTVVVAGEIEDIPHGQAFAIVRTHYVSTAEAWAVAKRAIELRAKRGKHLAAVPAVLEEEPVDHLANVEEAMRSEARVRTAVLLGRLIEIDQDYEDWGFQDLKRVLAGPGGEDDPEVPVRKSDGHSVVRLEDVQEALQGRSGRAG
jgi:S-DNA-T family DNA segregation ATPase FtsK/SpoIIIE